MGSVNLVPIDILEDSFEIEEGIQFDPSKIDYENSEKEIMRKAVLKVLQKVVDLSNSNIIINADGLMATKPIDQEVEWVGETGNWVPENWYAFSYWLILVP